MADLISRESFMRAIKYLGSYMLIDGRKVMERLQGYNPTSALNGYELCLKDISEVLADTPSVDAVEVVRCKDCKWYEEANGKDSGKRCGYGQCKSVGGLSWIVCDDDFRSSGERRADDAD